jgi:hypothetical protein
VPERARGGRAASDAAGGTVPLAEQIPASATPSATRNAFRPQIMVSHLATGMIPCRKPATTRGFSRKLFARTTGHSSTSTSYQRVRPVGAVVLA